MPLPSGAKFATFVEGRPVLASMEDVRAAAGIPDLAQKISDATTEARDRLNAVADAAAGGADALRDQAVRVQATIEAISTDIAAVVGGALPRIDSALAEAGERIQTARDDLAAERNRALGAEEQLSQRITSAEAGSGYDDTAINARVTDVDRARSDGDRALGERIDTAQSSYARGVTANPDFGQGKAGWSAIDWTVIDGAGGDRLLRSTAGAYNVLQGAGRFKLVDLNRAFRLHCTFRVLGAPQLTYVGLTLFDAAGAAVGNVYADGFVAVRAPGTYEVSQLYQGVNALLPNPTYTQGGKFPPGAASASPLFLANYPNPSSPVPGGYAEVLAFWLEDVTEALRVDARVTDEAATLAAADEAIAERVTTTEAQFRGEQGSVLLSRLSATETATTDGRFATAQRATSIETSLNDARGRLGAVETATTDGRFAAAGRVGVLEAASGVNSSLRNRYAVFSAWPDGQAYPSGWSAWDQGLGPERVAGSVGRFAARSNNAGLSSAGMHANWLTDPGLADVPPGTSWVLYADITLVAGQFGNQGAHVNFYNENGVATGAGFNLAFRDPDGLGTDNPGVAGRRYQMARLLTEGGPATRHAWLYAMQAWSPLGPQRNAVIDWHAIGIRQATPEEVKAQKADAALNAPGGVFARLADTDAALADLDNQYAAVARTEALEAQVNFAADSGLQRTINARIEDRATTIADAKAGAVSQTVAQLRSEYNGTAATVTQQAGTIADLDGRTLDLNYRTRAYWRAIADAGNNRAGVTIYADSNGGAGVNIIGDVQIDGKLTLNGSLGLGKLARSQFSTRGRWAGATPPTTPGRGQLAILMDQLLGPVGEGGVFVVQSATGVTSNEGQTALNQAGNKRFTYDSMGGGVFCQLVNVATGANMIVFGGNQPLTEIENVWGAVSVFVRWYVYNSAQDGETTFDPESGMSYQSLAATYTASAPSGSVKWTFV